MLCPSAISVAALRYMCSAQSPCIASSAVVQIPSVLASLGTAPQIAGGAYVIFHVCAPRTRATSLSPRPIHGPSGPLNGRRLARRVGCIRWLCRNAYVIAQELGREIGPIRPDERVKLRMNLKLPEDSGIAQRFEDGAAESRRQIDLATRPVAKAEPHHVAGHIARLDDMVIHDAHSSGATRLRGCPCLASCQFSINSCL